MRLHLDVTLTPAEEVVALRQEVEALKGKILELQQQYNRVELLYRSECMINMELQDLLKEHKIPYREAIAQYRGVEQ